MQSKVLVPISSSSNNPNVEVRKVGNVVESIHVSCNCGQVVHIKCEYANATESKPASQ